MYLSNLGWDEGVAEFDRRERPGFDDVKRIFGEAPSCYGQPGSSWGTASVRRNARSGACRSTSTAAATSASTASRTTTAACSSSTSSTTSSAWTSKAGPTRCRRPRTGSPRRGRSCWPRAAAWSASTTTRASSSTRSSGTASTSASGANPPREQWKLPPAKTPEESRAAYDDLRELHPLHQALPRRAIHHRIRGRGLYRDQARGRRFTAAELKAIAAAVGRTSTFQRHGRLTLAPSEVFALLERRVAGPARQRRQDRDHA